MLNDYICIHKLLFDVYNIKVRIYNIKYIIKKILKVQTQNICRISQFNDACCNNYEDLSLVQTEQSLTG